MDYYKFRIVADPATAEILTALLSQAPFDTFQDTDDGVEAFIPASALSPETEAYLHGLQAAHIFDFQKEFIPGQNWNVLWETNFHPVRVGSFCGIRADFHPPFTGVEHELVINPKMAFGTGHHETTYMMLEAMENLPFDGKVVLDYGCGTGVLAILASRLGAARVDAVEIEEEACHNARENCSVNRTDNVAVYHGTLDDVPGNAYDIVLANINRNVILDSLSTLTRILKPGGRLAISGFVEADADMMKNALTAHRLRLLETKRKNNWLALLAEAAA